MKNEKKCRKCKKTDKVSDDVSDGRSKTDPFGMYTGKPENPYEVPVQDADDL